MRKSLLAFYYSILAKRSIIKAQFYTNLAVILENLGMGTSRIHAVCINRAMVSILELTFYIGNVMRLKRKDIVALKCKKILDVFSRTITSNCLTK